MKLQFTHLVVAKILLLNLCSAQLAQGQEINLKGNDVTIADGSIHIQLADHSFFGKTAVDAGTLTRTFTIENTGSLNLVLGSNAVSISGSHSSDFSVTAQPASSISSNSSATFTISFDPSGEGTRNASVSINSNDTDENPYNFNISGWGWEAFGDSVDMTWVSGNSTADRGGNYGTKGVAASSNEPGSRRSVTTWTDYDGTFWLFGGFGRDASSNLGVLNDLWKWDGTHWTWVSGSNSINQNGSYGTQGVAVSSNVPGARYAAAGWLDEFGNLWLFGGDGLGTTNSGKLNDLWKWDGDNWTWISGSSSINQLSTYGTKGTAAAANVPGARGDATAWKDDNGDFWLFGGNGFTNNSGTYGYVNELWKWDGSEWTWMSGSKTLNQGGTYGTQGAAASSNVPGCRTSLNSWLDALGNAFLFGGRGFDANNAEGELNDIWKWDGSDWTWVHGDDEVDASASYGTKGTTHSSNNPGARMAAGSMIDIAGNVIVLGGYLNNNLLNDVWKWDGANWTWIGGSSSTGQSGSYGIKGVTASSNEIPARFRPACSHSSSGKLLAFGGNKTSLFTHFGDFWEIAPKSGSPLPVEMVYFNANWVGVSQRAVRLTWQTALEEDNSHFWIQRSVDGQSWNTVATIQGQGTKYLTTDYEYLDDWNLDDLKAERVYYRLKQVDYNGNFDVSDVRSLKLSQQKATEHIPSISLYPNPAKMEVHLQSTTKLDRVEVLNLHGHVVHTFFDTQSIDVSCMEPGIYLVRCLVYGQVVTKELCIH